MAMAATASASQIGVERAPKANVWRGLPNLAGEEPEGSWFPPREFTREDSIAERICIRRAVSDEGCRGRPVGIAGRVVRVRLAPSCASTIRVRSEVVLT